MLSSQPLFDIGYKVTLFVWVRWRQMEVLSFLLMTILFLFFLQVFLELLHQGNFFCQLFGILFNFV